MDYQFRNVNDAFSTLVSAIADGHLRTQANPGRAGDVLQVVGYDGIPTPVTVRFNRPQERVLFNQARDCNPFFHLYESLWMLAGRNDIEPLQWYSGNYAEQVQDGNDPRANGAYGYRWREAILRDHSGLDQLTVIVDHLRRNPESRRVVLQMWNVEDDLMKIDSSKDVCCNTAAYFSVRTTNLGGGIIKRHLDMTVTNRSNDLIWGMLGANVVHFSFLQEYLAACLKVNVGVYYQFTNNLHVYTDRFSPDLWLADRTDNLYSHARESSPAWNAVENRLAKFVPLVLDPYQFNHECRRFVDQAYNGQSISVYWDEPFFAEVAFPMALAFYHHKQREYTKAMNFCGMVVADDWRIASTNWIRKRQLAWEKKNEREHSSGSGVVSEVN